MANNRMFLVFRPTGRAVFLGKRMGRGWYDGPTKAIDDLFKDAENAGNLECVMDQDDFCLAMEVAPAGSPHVIDAWEYEDFWAGPGVRTLILKEEAQPWSQLVKDRLTQAMQYGYLPVDLYNEVLAAIEAQEAVIAAIKAKMVKGAEAPQESDESDGARAAKEPDVRGGGRGRGQ